VDPGEVFDDHPHHAEIHRSDRGVLAAAALSVVAAAHDEPAPLGPGPGDELWIHAIEDVLGQLGMFDRKRRICEPAGMMWSVLMLSPSAISTSPLRDSVRGL